MYRSKHFQTREIRKRDGTRRYALVRGKHVLDQFRAEEHADFVAAYCAVFHGGSYEVRARNAAKAALVEGHGLARLEAAREEAVTS